LRGVTGVDVHVIPGSFQGNHNYEAIRIACENILAAAGLEPKKKASSESDVLLLIRSEPGTVKAVAAVSDQVLVKRNNSEFRVETWKFMEFRPGQSWLHRECPTAESYMQFALDATNKLVSHIRRANKK
jgi:hypothetical protein